jgi:hypothetical protein
MYATGRISMSSWWPTLLPSVEIHPAGPFPIEYDSSGKLVLRIKNHFQWRIYSVKWVDLSTGPKGPGALKIRNK